MTVVYDYEEAVKRTIEKMQGRDLYEWHLKEVVKGDFAMPDFARIKVIKLCKQELGIKP